MYSYDELFYEYLRTGSARSARAVLPHVVRPLGIRSVLDIGCGAGAWLAEYLRLGIADVVGVDGDYVDRSVLMVDAKCFVPRDITQPFDFRKTYDLVQCLEVAEHVPAESGRTLVDNIVRHGSKVLFSAAVPGQGGKNHVNEQPYEFWRDRFLERGYRLFDFVRPAIRDEANVEPWYRYNLLFFAHDLAIGSLPDAVARCRVPDDSPIKDYSPPAYRLRKSILRLLPNQVVSWLAVLKHRLAVRTRL
jgi:SAM-dependent methyltransferase